MENRLIDILVGIFFVTPLQLPTHNQFIYWIQKPSIQCFVSNLQNLLCLLVTFPLLPSSRHPPVTPATWKPLRTFGASWLSGGSVLQGGRWKFWRTSFSRRERMGDRGENVRRIVICRFFEENCFWNVYRRIMISEHLYIFYCDDCMIMIKQYWRRLQFTWCSEQLRVDWSWCYSFLTNSILSCGERAARTCQNWINASCRSASLKPPPVSSMLRMAWRLECTKAMKAACESTPVRRSWGGFNPNLTFIIPLFRVFWLQSLKISGVSLATDKQFQFRIFCKWLRVCSRQIGFRADGICFFW